ncbi:hypothetical protein [Flavobacterium sp. YO12]|uniref:hypothetical protein n=1 Tax=Flavobacterium sp. YO12 TaxID=1920029 RepID=UPI00100AA9DB|nr:hypothetical protein [Flavobacterium sp. YO12]
MNLDLHRIRSITFVTVMLFCITIICPGIMFVFLFSKELFLETDTFKLILLSVSITMPISLVNSFLIGLLQEPERNDNLDDNLQLIIILGNVISLPIIYIPLMVKLFIDISLQCGVSILIALEIIIFLLAYILNRLSSKSK